MSIRRIGGLCVLCLAFLIAACGGANTNSNTANTNSGNTANTSNTRSSTDTTNTGQSTASNEYDVITTDVNGVKTETRTYKNNQRISKVVLTTRDGKRTAKVYSKTGEERAVPENKVEEVVNKSGDAIADAAGFVTDKSKEIASDTKQVGEKAIDKTKQGAEKVGEKTVEGAKTVGNKTVEGAKKAGKAVKSAVTP